MYNHWHWPFTGTGPHMTKQSQMEETTETTAERPVKYFKKNPNATSGKKRHGVSHVLDVVYGRRRGPRSDIGQRV